jgi:UDPglucose 6-dehydrogenase
MLEGRIAVVGAGYVGLVTAAGLASLGNRVHLSETRRDRLEALREGRIPLYEAGLQEAFAEALAAGRLTVDERPPADAGLAMVCVGTPIGDDGMSDLSQLQSALSDLDALLEGGTPLVIRSTLPPGSTQRVVEWTGVPPGRVLTNPEFLRQGTALHDFLHPTRIVIGHFPEATEETIDLVRGLYADLGAPVLVVDVGAAELIKNGANAFLALKLSFVNEIAALCEEYGTDVGDVLAGITLDPRIGSQYMRPSFGFGGSCLPKELQALATAGRNRGLPMHVTQAASDANRAQQARFAARILAQLDGTDGPAVAFLGLAFKAGTDDVRDSPALGVARILLDQGVRVVGYDPEAAGNAASQLPGLTLAASPEAAMAGADAAVITTEWPEFRDVDWSAARRSLRGSVVIDGRRLLDRAAVEAAGLRYVAVGTSSPAEPDLAPVTEMLQLRS